MEVKSLRRSRSGLGGAVVFASPGELGREALLDAAAGAKRYGRLERTNNTAEGLALLRVACAVHPDTDII